MLKQTIIENRQGVLGKLDQLDQLTESSRREYGSTDRRSLKARESTLCRFGTPREGSQIHAVPSKRFNKRSVRWPFYLLASCLHFSYRKCMCRKQRHGYVVGQRSHGTTVPWTAKDTVLPDFQNEGCPPQQHSRTVCAV